ncbi:MAG: helix-turn-helix domain-containing protein [Janthinobacterium lividum]
MFIDPLLVEQVLHAPYGEQRLRKAADHLHDDVILVHLLQALLTDVVDGSSGGPLLGESIVAAILHRLQAWNLAGQVRPAARLSQAQLRRLQAYVAANLADPIHLHHLAGLLDVSPRHLCRTLQATLGVSPHNFVVTCRLKQASALLRASGLSLEEIAEVTGFANRNHMSANFRRVLNTTPSQVRDDARS